MTTISETPSRVTSVNPDLQRQREYIQRMRNKGFDFGLTMSDAFIRGIRDIGYKSTGTALDELVDNAIQADATNIHVLFHDTEGTPDQFAIVDDGHGMDPEMIRLACIWGGTHRENDRQGFGRYGYGLPTASVSQGRRFSVYSRVENALWHRVTLDLDEISKGQYTDAVGHIIVPAAVAAAVPAWIKQELAKVKPEGANLTHGTIVLIEKLDRLSPGWRTPASLERNLLEHFGVIYRNWLRDVSMWVRSKQAQPVDPLFITQGARFYDLDEDRAEALPERIIEVKDPDAKPNAPSAKIRVRFSYMPPTFARVPDEKLKERGKTNARLGIMRDHNGIIVLRNGRQIDVLTRNPWTSFQNNDRYWGVEVDFPATLDEEFSITTSKQQAVLSERLWDILKREGVLSAINDLRRRYREDVAKLKAMRELNNKPKFSEQIMQEAVQFKTRRPAGDQARREREREENLIQAARRKARQENKTAEQAELELRAEAEQRPFKVEEESLPGAPFYRVEQRGGQEVLYINTEHPFYNQIHSGPGSTLRLRIALELLLFVLGDCELDTDPDGARRKFYVNERQEWSRQLRITLEGLDDYDNILDAQLAEEEFEVSDAGESGNRPSDSYR